uniref:CCHC-type domain-containing protein n=1 Tax=Anopheles epiroticus TaxID=199890 RepID=A0A182P4D0_9DIPT
MCKGRFCMVEEMHVYDIRQLIIQGSVEQLKEKEKQWKKEEDEFKQEMELIESETKTMQSRLEEMTLKFNTATEIARIRKEALEQHKAPTDQIQQQKPDEIISMKGKKRSTKEVIRVVPKEVENFAEVFKTIMRSNQTLHAVLPDMIDTLKRLENDTFYIRCKYGVSSEPIEKYIREELGKIGDIATIKVTKPSTVLVCSNLEGHTTVAELQEAMKQQHGTPVEQDRIKLRSYSNGLQRAWIRLPILEGSKLIGKQLKVGLVSVALKEEKLDEDHCYRCLERGHKAYECKGVDRSNLCFRCEATGHQAADCKLPIMCARCGGKHQRGSKKCKKLPEVPNEEQGNA